MIGAVDIGLAFVVGFWMLALAFVIYGSLVSMHKRGVLSWRWLALCILPCLAGFVLDVVFNYTWGWARLGRPWQWTFSEHVDGVLAGYDLPPAVALRAPNDPVLLHAVFWWQFLNRPNPGHIRMPASLLRRLPASALPPPAVIQALR